MQYLSLACDYDGTLARHGQVSSPTIHALERVVASGRQLLLITGRRLPHLQQVFPRIDLFAAVVAENGALLYQPASDTKKLLADAPPEQFIHALRARGVPLGTGEVIVTSLTSYETTVQEVIRDLGLALQIILNKHDLMILPAGIDKATGLLCALHALAIAPDNVVGVGDAENDLSFLALCGYAVAVHNALPLLKEQAAYTTKADDGDGVTEVIEQLMANNWQKFA